MGRMKQEYIAMTMGTQFTQYAVCRGLSIPLSKEQEKFQAYLERKYPTVAITKKNPEEEPVTTAEEDWRELR